MSGRNGCAIDAVVDNLTVKLSTEEEEQLVVVVVEVRMREDHRAAEIETWIVVPGVGAGSDLLAGGVRAGVVIEPVVGVQRVVAGVNIRFAVELLAARLADRVNGDGAFGVIGAEVRGLDRDLGSHVDVGVFSLAAVAARVNNVGSVRGDVKSGGA